MSCCRYNGGNERNNRYCERGNERCERCERCEHVDRKCFTCKADCQVHKHQHVIKYRHDIINEYDVVHEHDYYYRDVVKVRDVVKHHDHEPYNPRYCHDDCDYDRGEGCCE